MTVPNRFRNEPARLLYVAYPEYPPVTLSNSLLMLGVNLYSLPPRTDTRGTLYALEGGDPLPFALARLFLIKDCPTDAVRANHAVTAHQALVAVSGGVTADIDNGVERQTLRLDDASRVLHLSPGVWLRLREFSADTTVLVTSSQRFVDVVYFDAPQPHLLEELPPKAGR